MRKIFKLLMSVVAVAVTFACATDATEDLYVKVGGGTQLTLSLDGTRTQLGEKVGDKYPITWSENDLISVNGETSKELTVADGANTADAIFKFDKELTTPYFVAYPAADAANQVKFAAIQHYNTNTSFESGVSTMYGYSKNGENVELNHLTGVLKIGIKGDATITSMRITTVDRQPIAGTFNAEYDAKNDKYTFTPAEGATSEVITCYFDQFDKLGDGLDLSVQDGTTYLYVAVPAVNGGVYNELYVTLIDAQEGVMYATIKADTNKPLKVGDIREFNSDITYKAIDTEELFVIDNYSALDSFKQEVEKGSNLNAVLVADIDVEKASATEGAWKSINAPTYTGTFNGNGYAISGLKAPLFDTVAATIKGVHLRNVNITSASTVNVGALVNTYLGASVTHCSAEGTMDITLKQDASCSVSGLVAYVGADTEFSDLVNKVNITVDGTLGTSLNVGGISGQNDEYNDITAKNLSNKGTLKVAGTQEIITTIGKNLNVGGFIGYTYGKIKAADETFTNNGSIEVQYIEVASNANIGGTFGRINKEATVECLNNLGSIKLTGVKVTSNICLGGVVGQISQPLTSNSAVNSGAIEIVNSSDIPATVYVGGTIGYINNTTTIKNLTNETTGTLKITNSVIKGKLNFGGIIGQINSKATLSNLHNKGAATFDTMTVMGSYCNIGGMYGYNANADTTLNTLTNEGAINLSNVTIDSNTDIGGLIGTATANTTLKGKLENKGDITCYNVTVTSNQPAGIGGIIGLDYDLRDAQTAKVSDLFITTDVTSIVNSGDIKCIGGSFKRYLGVAGIYGLNKNDALVKNATNTGDVICASTAELGCYVGGLSTAVQATPAIENSKFFGHVAAFIWDGTEAGALTVNSNAGMLTSAASDSATLKDCKVGGWLGTSAEVAKDANGKLDVKVTYDTELKGTNYLKYMYSTEATDANGCEYWNGK